MGTEAEQISDRASEACSGPAVPARRDFISTAGSLAMAGGLAAGYGTFGAMAGRFLFPARKDEGLWLFVAPAENLKQGEALRWRIPNGLPVNITRLATGGNEDDFLALSSTCPHLGCQVHWEPHKNRYFCPCHNGTFDPSGKATGGPPGDAGQSLPRYPLRIENGLLFIRVPQEGVS